MCKYLSNNTCTVVEEWHHGSLYLGYFSSSTHFDLETKSAGKEGRLWVWVFFRTIVTLMPETTLVSFRTLAFFFPLVTNTFSSFQRHSIPFDSWPLLLFQFSCVWRPSFVIEVSDPNSLHHGFQLLIVWNRYLLMNLQIVQFQYGFEFIRLMYSRFVQTFQDIIRWNFCQKP